MLAGVSIDYYTRLEQGRERDRPPEVLETLAAALRLDRRRTCAPLPARRAATSVVRESPDGGRPRA